MNNIEAAVFVIGAFASVLILLFYLIPCTAGAVQFWIHFVSLMRKKHAEKSSEQTPSSS
jgi:antibiotic biosynthesis monooxygenase (ABM) superfamily enzyme